MTTETQEAGAATNEAGGTQEAEAKAAEATSAEGVQGTEKTTDKPTEGEAKPEDKPIEYDFKAPEGMELNQDDLGQFKEIAKELKLAPEAAQKVVDLAIKREQARAEAFAEQVGKWAETVKADKELGNAENLAAAKKVIDDFGTDELKGLLNSTGMGNHPEVVRFVQKISKAISEDAVIAGRAGGTKPPKSAAEILYGTPTK